MKKAVLPIEGYGFEAGFGVFPEKSVGKLLAQPFHHQSNASIQLRARLFDKVSSALKSAGSATCFRDVRILEF
jgi:hypothetical protein